MRPYFDWERWERQKRRERRTAAAIGGLWYIGIPVALLVIAAVLVLTAGDA